MAAAHTQLIKSILTELRAACEQHGVEWPAATEAEIRSYLRTTLGVRL